MSPLFIQIFAETIFLPVKTVSTISKAIQRVETNIFVKWLLTLTSFPRGYTANISSCVYYLVFTLRIFIHCYYMSKFLRCQLIVFEF